MRLVDAVLAIAAYGLLAALPAGAAPLAYEFGGLAAGTLDGAPFPLQGFRVTMLGEADDVFSNGAGILVLDGFGADFALDVSGAGSIDTPLRVAVNQNFGGVSLGVAGGLDLFGFYDVAFAAYDLASPLGPVVSTGSYDQPMPLVTSAGSLVFSNVDGLVFEAPEPASLVSAVAALVALVTTSRRGRSRRGSSARRA